MKVRIRYLSRDIARRFGSSEKRETIRLSDNARYGDLLSLLNERYKKAVKELYDDKYKKMMWDTFIFICEGKFIEGMKDKPINSNSEVLVTYADLGG